MKKISIIICILICSIFIFGQNKPQEATNWIKFSPQGEEFAVETPVSFKSQSFSKDNSSRRYFCKTEQVYLFIFVEDRRSDKKNDLFQFKNVIGFVFENKAEGVKGKFGSEDAEKFEFVDSEGFFHTILIVKTFDFVQIFQTVSHNKNDPTAQKFLSSIQIKNNSSSLVEMPKMDSLEKTNETNIKENSKEISDGKGVGNGSGGSNGVGVSEPTKTPSIKPTPIQIKPTTKPPPYTDNAKFYQIEGSVLLRVTFLADGKIGAIVPATKLPFGLTNNAIETAKNVSFEPATRNGVPVTIIKTLQFTFTMY